MTRDGTPLDRRQVLAGLGSVLTAGLAGCSGVTSREFSAAPVRLPDAVHGQLGLTELFTDAETATRTETVGGQEFEVSITSQTAGYARAPTAADSGWWAPRTRPLVAAFAGVGRETTPGSGSAINVVASELGLGRPNPQYVQGETTMRSDQVTLVVPEHARHDGAVALEDVLAVHHAEDLGTDELTVGEGTNYLVTSPEAVLPGRSVDPAEQSDWQPDGRWIVVDGNGWIPADPTDLRCLVCLGERTPEEVFGVEEMPGRRLEAGERVRTTDTILFAPAPKEYPDPDEWVEDPATVFDAGYPTPAGAPTYGLGVLATPDAQVQGTSVNPLARQSVEELLTGEQGRDVLADAGLTDADTVEWLRGPERYASVFWSFADDVDLLDEEAAFEPFGGVVSGEAGPWAVAVYLARATPDDVVVAAAVQRRPVGTVDGRALFGDGEGFIDQRWAVRGARLTSKVHGSLVAEEES